MQRRLDQTLGKPGSYLAGIDRVGNVRPMTVGARMYRVEQQLGAMDRKLDQLTHALNNLTMLQKPQQTYYTPAPLVLPPTFDYYNTQPYQMSTASGMTAQQLQGLQLPAGPSQANTPLSSMQPHLEDDV